MSEREPFNEIAAEHILGAPAQDIPAEDTRVKRFGNGRRFPTPSGRNLDVFSGAFGITGRGLNLLFDSTDTDPVFTPDEVRLEGSIDGSPLTFSFNGHTGAVLFENTAPARPQRLPQADIDVISQGQREAEQRREERQGREDALAAFERQAEGAIERAANPLEGADAIDLQFALIARAHLRLPELAADLAARENISQAEAEGILQRHLVTETLRFLGDPVEPSKNTPPPPFARLGELLGLVDPENEKASASVHQLRPPADTAQAEDDQDPHMTPEPASQPERGTPVSFTGRIGKLAPHPREGAPTTYKLAVAEHPVDTDGQEQTVWHEVWPSRKLAPKVVQLVEAETLNEGAEVSVRGYQHRHPPKEGKAEGKPFVRAFMISPVRGKQAPQ